MTELARCPLEIEPGQIWKNKRWHGAEVGYFMVMSCDNYVKGKSNLWDCAYSIGLDCGWGMESNGWRIRLLESEFPKFAEYMFSLKDLNQRAGVSREMISDLHKSVSSEYVMGAIKKGGMLTFSDTHILFSIFLDRLMPLIGNK